MLPILDRDCGYRCIMEKDIKNITPTCPMFVVFILSLSIWLRDRSDMKWSTEGMKQSLVKDERTSEY